MSAAELRQAAETLRRLSTNATPGAWKLWGMTVMADQDGTSNVDTAVSVAHTLYRDKQGKPRTWDARYIATMYPGVGLALADWLDAAAQHIASHDCDAHCEYPDGCSSTRAALAVARLINGGAS